MTHPPPESTSPRSRRSIVVLLGALAALGPFSIDTYLPAFPDIASTYGVSVGRVGDTLAAYFLGICVGQLAYGPWMDRSGRRVPLLVGLAVYALASLACAAAPGVGALAGLRLLQALGGCAGMVASRALVRDLFPSEAAQILSSLLLVMGVAPVIAPSVGGWLAALAGWRSIFVFLALVSIVLFAVLWRSLPEPPRHPHLRSLRPRSLLAEWWEILRHPHFVAWGFGGSLASGGLYAYLAGSPAGYMQDMGLASTVYAWVFALNACGMIAASQLNRPLLRRFRSEVVARAALLVQILSSIAVIAASVTGIHWIVYPALWLFLFGYGLASPNIGALVLRPFGHNAGSASALSGSLQMAGGALLAGLVGILPMPPLAAMGTAQVAAVAGGLAVMASERALARRRSVPGRATF